MKLIVQFVVHANNEYDPYHEYDRYDNRVNKDELHYFLYFK